MRSFRAETLDYVWLAEEPPIDIYTEALTRTNVGASPVWLTFTPLQGVSTVVKRFLHEKSEDRHNVVMTIDDVEHYSNDEKKKIIASYPPHEAEARIKGIAVLGSGRIFPVAEETIAIDNREFSRRTGRGSAAWTSVGINNLTLSVPAHPPDMLC
ncbi:MAG: terminase family protein [Pseudolabrys sp.]